MLLVTGGAGYIGSHTTVLLLQAGYDVVVLDNLSNSSLESIRRVEQITQKKINFVEGDIRDEQVLTTIFSQYSIDAVIHFAALKAVGESMLKPLEYFDNNIAGTIQLLKAMQHAKVFNLVFSSSATVYGDSEHWELNESMPVSVPSNNYGYTKLTIEQLLAKTASSDSRWSFANLRYFNPIGAHRTPRPGAVVMLSGRVADPGAAPPAGASATPVFWGHGDADSVVPVSLVEPGAALLASQGAVVTPRVYPGLGHGIDARELRDVEAFLKASLGQT
ncbi:MAG: SDR family NAD(P)-dependent oxidoreductase [Burkholderiales bacterium]|nr:MAG: SDR family NAD(P)-dependent oxidoreductase [Burkholderiales bacterium]